MQEIFGKTFSFSSHEEARSFFLMLQNEIKNMNFLAYLSEEYKQAMKKVRSQMESKTMKIGSAV
jgi:V/A-type H+-transporting ATPase subunit A